MPFSPLLRTALKLDAASCLALAALVLPTAAALNAPMGVDAAILRAAAIGLIPIGLFILWLGTRRDAPAALAWLVIAGNLGWVAASLGAANGLPGVTPLGQALIVAQALAVLAVTGAEWIGLRKSLGSSRAAV